MKSAVYTQTLLNNLHYTYIHPHTVPMIILGLDPGIARTGFGVINTAQPNIYVQCGCLTTPAHEALEDRLLMLYQDLTSLLTQHRPDLAVVEEVFFGKNKTTALLTAHARGVILKALREHSVAVESLTPLQIKSRLTGYGGAKKQQVQYVVQQQLNLSAVPQPDDAADALAAALCFTR